jgi:hypothetical protein
MNIVAMVSSVASRHGNAWGAPVRPSGRVSRRMTVAAAVALLGLGCTPAIHVRTAYDERVDLQRLRRFAMLEPNKPVPTPGNVDPFTMQRLRQMVFNELVSRGYRPVEPEDAQFLVSVLGGVQGRVEVYHYGYPYSYRWYGPQYDVRRYDEGTIIVDFVDPVERAVVWRGVGMTRVTEETSDERLGEVVSRILSEFPPLPES